MALTRLPGPVGSSVWDALGDPPVVNMEPGWVPVAVGGHLDTTTLVGAYRQGIVPWAPTDPGTADELSRTYTADVMTGKIPTLSPEEPSSLRLPWWSPDPRGVIPVGGLHVSRRLREWIRSCGWTATLDHDFTTVVRGCARGGPAGWITAELVDLYAELHQVGWAHSSEVWDGHELVGGHFGLLVGGVYVLDSMFYIRSNASKIALVDIDARLAAGGAELIDVQLPSAHFRAMGALEMAREYFVSRLRALRDRKVQLVVDSMPVKRLIRPRSS
jgi:leucyl/phenylalanyl-tRNA--protein transferase